jgi:hypothetical protein
MMTAAAHQLDDEPTDRAEEPMTPAAFEIIARAHRLCDHLAAVEVRSRHDQTDPKLGNSELSKHDHDRVLPPQSAAAICQRLCKDLNEGSLLRDLESFDRIAIKLETETEGGGPRARRARSEPRACRARSDRQVAHHFNGRAANSTVEALAFSLRSGVGALKEPATRRRLLGLSDRQLLEVCARVRRYKPEIAPIWSDDDVNTMMRLREALR